MTVRLKLPKPLCHLCDGSALVPFSAYIQRKGWKLNRAAIERDFLNKKGVYCFWWTGPEHVLLDAANDFSHGESRYRTDGGVQFPHGKRPLYVGMTAKAAMRGSKGSGLSGRLVDRVNRFPRVFTAYYRKKHGFYELTARKSATCSNFDFFRFPDRVLGALRTVTNRPDLTMAEAERVLVDHPRIVKRFAEEFFDHMYDNYAISFVGVDSESEMFYLEALAIGVFRPWFNHS